MKRIVANSIGNAVKYITTIIDNECLKRMEIIPISYKDSQGGIHDE